MRADDGAELDAIGLNFVVRIVEDNVPNVRRRVCFQSMSGVDESRNGEVRDITNELADEPGRPGHRHSADDPGARRGGTIRPIDSVAHQMQSRTHRKYRRIASQRVRQRIAHFIDVLADEPHRVGRARTDDVHVRVAGDTLAAFNRRDSDVNPAPFASLAKSEDITRISEETKCLGEKVDDVHGHSPSISL